MWVTDHTVGLDDSKTSSEAAAGKKVSASHLFSLFLGLQTKEKQMGGE